MEPLVIVCKDRAEWLEARRDGLGASDAAAVLGISPWKTNVQLWEEKCRLVQPEDIGDKPAVQYADTKMPKSGGTFTGTVGGVSPTSGSTKGFRNIYFGGGAPASGLGANGDIYINIG